MYAIRRVKAWRRQTSAAWADVLKAGDFGGRDVTMPPSRAPLLLNVDVSGDALKRRRLASYVAPVAYRVFLRVVGIRPPSSFHVIMKTYCFSLYILRERRVCRAAYIA